MRALVNLLWNKMWVISSILRLWKCICEFDFRPLQGVLSDKRQVSGFLWIPTVTSHTQNLFRYLVSLTFGNNNNHTNKWLQPKIVCVYSLWSSYTFCFLLCFCFCLFVCLFVFVFICLFVCLFLLVCLFVCFLVFLLFIINTEDFSSLSLYFLSIHFCS